MLFLHRQMKEHCIYFLKPGLRVAQDVWIVLTGPGWNIIMKWLRPIDHKTNKKHNWLKKGCFLLPPGANTDGYCLLTASSLSALPLHPFSAHSPSSISSWSLPRDLSHALQYVKKFPLGSWRPDLALGRAQLLLPKSRPQELESPAVRGSTVPGPPRGTLTCLLHRWEKRGPSYALVQRLRMWKLTNLYYLRFDHACSLPLLWAH